MEFYPETDGVSLLMLFNFGGAMLASLWLTIVYRRARANFVKPSLLIIAMYHFSVQWPLVLLTGFTESFLIDPMAVSVLVNCFVLIGLLLSQLTWRRTALEVWQKLDQNDANGSRFSPAAILAVAGLGVLLAAIYLAYVPLSETGLYVLLTEPAGAAEARENSLKLLVSPLAQYAITFVSTIVAPLFTCLVVAHLNALSGKLHAANLMWLPALALLWLLAALNGAKGTIVFLIFVTILTIVWRRRLNVSAAGIVGGLAAMLAPALVIAMTLASVDADADTMSKGDATLAQAAEVANRAFVIPTVVGIWYVDYAQQYGATGIAGISRLAGLTGTTPIDLPNLVGLTYGPIYYGHEVLESISATVGYLFAFYGYFGAWGLALSLFGLLLSDLILIALRRMPAPLIAPMMALVTLGALKFTQSDYMSVWLTHGFGLTVLLVWLNRDWLVRPTQTS